LIDPSVPRFPAQPNSWSEVARICRRICLLRECQQLDAAEQLRRNDLVAALEEARTTVESDAALEQKLDAIFAAEAERVANAAVLAELIAHWERGRPARTDSVAGEQPMLSTHFEPLAAPAPAPRRDPADIASFIDEMIAQERPAPRTAPTRRAS
jgi:hypothetical protein